MDKETGEEREVRIDNSCPRCGWFTAERKKWPRWDGVIHEDILASPFEASDIATKRFMPRVKAAEMRQKIAEERANEADERAATSERAREAELERRVQAEQEVTRVRASIASSERACAAASARVLAQFERECSLRRAAEERLAEAESPAERRVETAPHTSKSSLSAVRTLARIEAGRSLVKVS